MKFLDILKTIGEDIEKGIAVALPIVGTFEPAVGPILISVAQIIAAFEKLPTAPTGAQVSSLVQAVATVHTFNQASAAQPSA